MGKVYYLMGDVDLAASFHCRFSGALVEDKESPQRFLSNQRIKLLMKNYQKYDSMCILFLIHFKVPILKTT